MENNTTNTAAIRVGIVDDHILVATAFARLLKDMNGIEPVMEVYSGEELLLQLKTASILPDILLVDIVMDDGISGIEATEQITELYPEIKVIAVTGEDDDDTMLQMMGAGACGYLLKDFHPRQVEEAIRKIHASGKYEADLFHLTEEGMRAPRPRTEPVSFTAQEKTYLQFVCNGYSYRSIAEEMEVSVDAVNYYKACIAEKMGSKSLVVIAFEVVRMGIIKYEGRKFLNK